MGRPLTAPIYESPLAPSPLTIGFWNCAIVVPQGVVESLDDDQLVSVLAHEAAHVCRRDTLFACFQQVAAIGFWWNPLVRVINSRINLIREQICDDLVVKHFGDGVPLARAIVKVAEWSNARSTPLPLVASLMSGMESIEKRIARLTQANRTITLSWSRSSLAALSLSSALLLAAALMPVVRRQVLAAMPPAPSTPQKTEWKIRINVVDAEGKPLAKARIGTVQDQEKYDSPEWYESDELGSYTLTVPDRRPKYLYILAKAEGYTPARAFWWNIQDRGEVVLPAEFVFKLEKGIAVGGVVVDEEGKPVEGASVRFSASGNEPRESRVKSGVSSTFLTDRDGKWRCEDAPKEITSASINIRHRDFASDFFEHSSKSIDSEIKKLYSQEYAYTLQKGFSITGRIVDENDKPIEGVALVVCELNSHSANPIIKTDADGRYRFEHIATRPEIRVTERIALTISAYKPGYMPIQERVPGFGERPMHKSTDKERIVDIRLDPGNTVALRVVDSLGKPVKRAQVYINNWGSTRALEHFREHGIPQQTDDNGIWKWTDAPFGEDLFLDVDQRGFARVRQHQLIVDASNIEETIVMKRPQIITGSVIDATTKKPITAFEVEKAFENVAGHPDGLSWTNAYVYGKDGKYRGPIDMPPGSTGSYKYRILAEGYESTVSESIPYAEGEVTIDFELKPKTLKENSSANPKAAPATENKAWRIRVRAVDVDGKPIANPRIGTINESPEAKPEWHQGDRDGRCTLTLPDRLPKFLYILARADGYSSMQAYWWNQAGVSENALPADFVFEMEKGTTVGGAIVDEQEKPVEGAAVKFYASGMESNPARRAKQVVDETYVTDSEGKWRCDTAPQKITTARIVVSHPEFAADSFGHSLDDKVKALRDQSLTLALKKGFDIRGRIVDEKGDPIAGATLTFSPTGMFSHVPFQKTDSDGRYRFDNVTYSSEPPGLEQRGMLIGVVKQGYAPLLERFQPADKRVDEKGKENELLVNMKMKRGVPITFRVVDTKHKPLKDAWVLSLIWQQTQVLMELRDHGIPQRTDENGIWRWNDFPSGEKMKFIIRVPGYADITTPDITASDSLFVMKRAQILVGSVTNAVTKEPIKEFSLERKEVGVVSPPYQWTSDGIRGKDGKYRGLIDQTPSSGKYTYRVIADGFEPAESDAILYKEGEVTINFELYRKAPSN